MPSLRLPCSCWTWCCTWCTWRRPDCRKVWSWCSRCRWLASQAALCCSMEVRHSFQAPRVRCRHTRFSRPTLRFTSASSLPLHSCSCHTERHLSRMWRRYRVEGLLCALPANTVGNPTLSASGLPLDQRRRIANVHFTTRECYRTCWTQEPAVMKQCNQCCNAELNTCSLELQTRLLNLVSQTKPLQV